MTLIDHLDRVTHIARETYAEAIDDVKPFLHEHWEELALYPDIPLDPEFEMYATLDKQGHLAAYTVRNPPAPNTVEYAFKSDMRTGETLDMKTVPPRGELVGYALYLVRKNPHYRNHVWALSDVVLVRKSYRTLGLGAALFDFIEADLRDRGVHVMHTTTKYQHPELAMLLRSRGHFEAELGFSLRL